MIYTQILDSNTDQNKNSNKPCLWTSDIEAAICLSYHFKVIDLCNPPDTISPKDWHIVLVDKNTPEARVRESAYKIRIAGGDLDVYQTQLPLIDLVSEPTLTEKDLAVQFLEYNQPFDEWLKSKSQTPLTTKEATAIACVVQKYDNFPKVELEEIRKRCNVNSFDWKAILEEVNYKRKFDPILLKLEVNRYVSETDPISKLQIRREICSRFHITKSELQELSLGFNSVIKNVKATVHDALSFMQLATGGISWVHPGLIPSCGVTVLGGDPGIGKTTLAYDLAGAVLNGDEFLGDVPVKQGKVLFIASDELEHFTQDKLVNRGIYPSENWQVVTHWDVSQWGVLENILENFKPDLVIVDSFSAIHKSPEFDENSAQAKSTVYALEGLSSKYSFACLLIHHNNKSKDARGVGKLRGNSAIAAAASAVLLLEGEPNSELRRLTTPKIRGAAPQNFTLRLDAYNGHWEVTSGGVDTAIKSCGEKILEFLGSIASDVWLSVEEIVNEIKWGTETVRTALRRLTERGQMIKKHSDTNYRQRVYRLQLTHPPSLPPIENRPTSETDINQESHSLVTSLVTVGQSEVTNERPTSETHTEQQNILVGQDNPDKEGGERGGVTHTTGTETKSQCFKKGDTVKYVGEDNKSLRGKKLTVSTINEDGIWVRTASKIPRGPFSPSSLRKF